MCILKCLLGKPDFLTYFSRIIRPLNANYSKIFSKFFFYQTRIVHFIKTYFKPRIVDMFFTTFKDWLTDFWKNTGFSSKHRIFISYFKDLLVLKTCVEFLKYPSGQASRISKKYFSSSSLFQGLFGRKGLFGMIFSNIFLRTIDSRILT